jgi:CheY-like chemotaxis protein
MWANPPHNPRRLAIPGSAQLHEATISYYISIYWNQFRRWKTKCIATNWNIFEEEMADKKVLIVDDDRESRNLLREVLEANGYSVEAVQDSSSARKELEGENSYQVVIADLRMPGESGIDLLRELRRRKTPHHIVLMSSFISETERQWAIELGVEAMLDKPFRLTELLELLARITGKSTMEIPTKGVAADAVKTI